MKEMTSEEAKRFAVEGVWKKLTPVERAWMQLYQPYICIPIEQIYEGLRELLGRPVYSHEMWFDAMAGLRREVQGRTSESRRDSIASNPNSEL